MNWPGFRGSAPGGALREDLARSAVVITVRGGNKNTQIRSDLLRWASTFVCGLGESEFRNPTSEERAETVGVIGENAFLTPILISRAGGILKRDSVTMHCLWGDSWVSKRDKGSQCHVLKRDKKLNCWTSERPPLPTLSSQG